VPDDAARQAAEAIRLAEELRFKEVEVVKPQGRDRRDEDEIPVGENYDYQPPKTLEGYNDMVDATSNPTHVDLEGWDWDGLPGAEQPRPFHPDGCARSFKVGKRGDMRQVMRPIFESFGVCEVSEDSPSDVEWSRPWEAIPSFFRKKAIAKGQIVNSIGGLPQQIGVKPALARLQQRCFARFGYKLPTIPAGSTNCRFTKPGYAVSRTGDRLQMPISSWRKYNLLQIQPDEAHRIWIMKMRKGFNQVGIHMFSFLREDMQSEEKATAWLSRRVPDGEWVLQDYIMSPMTFQGHKFDLRIWAIVTSLDPLRLFLLGTGIPKVSTWRYSNDPKHTKNGCIHYLFPGTSECYFSKDPMAKILDPYPQLTTTKYWYDNIHPKGEVFWKGTAWASLERALCELMLLARQAILHIDHTIKRRGLRYKRTFFLSPDFVFDDRGNAYAVEVNTNGYMIGNLHSMFFNLHKFQVSVARLMGVGGYSGKRHYLKALFERTKAFCKSHSCPPAFEREIWELVHEDMHCSRSWYRIFPATEARGYVKHFLATPQWAKLYTPLDTLTLSWLKVGWTPTHTHDENGTVMLRTMEQDK